MSNKIEISKSTSLSNIRISRENISHLNNGKSNKLDDEDGEEKYISKKDNNNNHHDSNNNNNSKKQHPQPPQSPTSSSSSSTSQSASSSSILAALSEISFSTTDSTSNVSSSVSYADVASGRASVENLTNQTKIKHKEKSISIKLPDTTTTTTTTNTTTTSESPLNESFISLNSLDISQLMAPYFNKKFYGKEWLYSKLDSYIKKIGENNNNVEDSNTNNDFKKHPNCLVLLGEIGTGKTHLCCELKWPTNSDTFGKNINNNISNNNNKDLALSEHISSVYFFNFLNKKHNHIKQFYNHFSRSIQDLALNLINNSNNNDNKDSNQVLFKKNIKIDLKDYYIDENNILIDNEVDEIITIKQEINYFDCSTKITTAKFDINTLILSFIDDILKPIKNIETNNNYFIVIDGLDDAILQHQLESMNKKTNERVGIATAAELEVINNHNNENYVDQILYFLNKTFTYFPHWLNLIITSRRCNEKLYLRKHLTQFKYEKLSIDKCLNFSSLLINRKSICSKINSNSNMNQDTCFSASKSIHDKLSEHFKSNPVSTSQSTHSIAIDNNNIYSSPNNNLRNNNNNNINKSSIDLYNAANLANLKDLQIYILKRLDDDIILKSKFTNQNNSIEMLNILLIKSNYCILYVEKVFDLIVNGIISSSDIKDIPATLNGLYLYLIQSILTKLSELEVLKEEKLPPVKDLLYSIFGLSFIEFKSFNKSEIFNRLKFRFVNLNFKAYEKIFDFIEPILFKKTNNNENNQNLDNINNNKYLTYFHSSLIEWFNDVKYCTPSYLINLSDSHFIMANFYFDKLLKIRDKYFMSSNIKDGSQTLDNLWNIFKYHLFNSNKIQLLNDQHINYYYLLCKHEYEFNINNCKKKHKIENSTSIIDIKLNDENNNRVNMEACLFELLTKGDLISIKLLVSNDLMLKSILTTMTDSYNQNSLLIAVKLNNLDLVDYLVKIKSIDLDHCDNTGWTALRYSAWTGNENLVRVLLESGACIDASDTEGRTALRAAVFSGHENIVKILIKYGANGKFFFK
jgi:hypothetical protein